MRRTTLLVDTDRDVGCVVAKAPLGDRLAEGIFQHDGVGGDLEAVGRPSLRGAIDAPRRLPSLVLVRQIRPVAASEAIHLSFEAERVGPQFKVDGITLLLGGEGGVEFPAGVDAGVGDADLLDLF